MIYTSYFGNKKIPKNIIQISICLKVPEFYKGLQYKKLAPTEEILYNFKNQNQNENKTIYVNQYYIEILNKLNVHEIVDELYRLANCDKSVDIVLLCYEKYDEFCHRHLVGKWLSDNGYPCEELLVGIDLDYPYEPPIYDWIYETGFMDNYKDKEGSNVFITDDILEVFKYFDNYRLFTNYIMRHRNNEEIIEYFNFDTNKFDSEKHILG